MSAKGIFFFPKYSPLPQLRERSMWRKYTFFFFALNMHKTNKCCLQELDMDPNAEARHLFFSSLVLKTQVYAVKTLHCIFILFAVKMYVN